MRSQLAALLAFMAMASVAATAQSDDKIDLKFRFVPGSYVRTMNSEATHIRERGGAFVASFKTASTRAMSIYVGKPDADGNKTITLRFTRIHESFESNSHKVDWVYDSREPPPVFGKGIDPPEMIQIARELTRATITVLLGPDEKINEVSGLDKMWDELAKADASKRQLAAAGKKRVGDASIRKMVDAYAEAIPGRPVNVGDEWTPAGLETFGPDHWESGTYKLKAVEDGGKTAVIELRVKGTYATSQAESEKRSTGSPATGNYVGDLEGVTRVRIDNLLVSVHDMTFKEITNKGNMTWRNVAKTTIKTELAPPAAPKPAPATMPAGDNLPLHFGDKNPAAIKAARLAVANNGPIATALKEYYVDMQMFPTTEQGLRALQERPTDKALAAKWQGPYIDPKVKLTDPWGIPYEYTCPGEHNTEGFDLLSAGPDGMYGTLDDIHNWADDEKPAGK